VAISSAQACNPSGVRVEPSENTTSGQEKLTEPHEAET
jgi:hypothetical protein